MSELWGSLHKQVDITNSGKNFFISESGLELHTTLGLGVVAVFRVTSSWDMLPIKDMKIKIDSKAGLYSSVGYVAE